MANPLIIAKSKGKDLAILPALANRHGLITGAAGTGKAITLQKMAEGFSKAGVPVFLADVRGNLTGIGVEGDLTPQLKSNLAATGVKNWSPAASPIVLWDIFGKKGHPIRATITDMGPLLLSRLLSLSDDETGILQLVFKIADDNDLLLLNMKDLKTLVQFVSDNAKKLTTDYGVISSASISAIQTSLMALEQKGVNHYFGEPILDINDLMRFNIHGQGVVNILAAETLFNYPKLYSVYLLWLLSELFEQLPEVGDTDKPKLVFFFDEAHLLFSDISPTLLQKVEQMVRLIRSRGVGVYFITQKQDDLPTNILNQLGNRIQLEQKEFTAHSKKISRNKWYRAKPEPGHIAKQSINPEALISFLDEKGNPNPIERSAVIAPTSRIGAMTQSEIDTAISNSTIYGKYEKMVERKSAYEIIKAGYVLQTSSVAKKKPEKEKYKNSNGASLFSSLSEFLFGYRLPFGGKQENLMQTATEGVTRQISNQIGRHIYRGILGGISGGRKK